MSHQMFFCIWGRPHWIQDGKLNTLAFFVYVVAGLVDSGLVTFQIPPILKKRYNFTLRWLVDLGNMSLKFNNWNFELFALYPCYFFICCLSDPWLTVGYYWENSLSHLVLITAFGLSIFGPKVSWRGGYLHLAECVVGFDHNGITHSAKHPK